MTVLSFAVEGVIIKLAKIILILMREEVDVMLINKF